MAKLILSEKEKNAATYLEWNDVALGRAVKKLAVDIRNNRGDDALALTACATLLACASAKRNAAQTIITLEGVTEGEKNYGFWSIIVQQGRIEI
jgi:hypothetical protein